MLMEQIILNLNWGVLGPWSCIYPQNWLFSRQNKNLGKSSSELFDAN